jgi:quinol monooxygenase YgiN
MIINIVHVHVKPESVEAFREATLQNGRKSVLEPAIGRFEVIQQIDDPSRFVLIEGYRTPDGQAQHRETHHYKTWRDTVADMMAEPRSSAKYNNLFPPDAAV